MVLSPLFRRHSVFRSHFFFPLICLVFAVSCSSGQNSTGVVVNGTELIQSQLEELEDTYGRSPPGGEYWYDSRSGLYGLVGHEAAGFINPNHSFGSLAADASRGASDFFLNGREMTTSEVLFILSILGLSSAIPGNYTLDGTTGILAGEGELSYFSVNFFDYLKSSWSSGENCDGWSSSATGAYGNSCGGCTFVNIPGSGSVTSGCG
jgi:hypothetical protein